MALPFILYFVSSAYALPKYANIHRSTDMPVSLIVIVTVSLFLAFLCFLKRLFIRRRQIQAHTLVSNESRYGGLYNSSLVPLSSSCYEGLSGKTWKDCQNNGFLVGFCGSPTREIKSVLNKSYLNSSGYRISHYLKQPLAKERCYRQKNHGNPKSIRRSFVWSDHDLSAETTAKNCERALVLPSRPPSIYLITTPISSKNYALSSCITHCTSNVLSDSGAINRKMSSLDGSPPNLITPSDVCFDEFHRQCSQERGNDDFNNILSCTSRRGYRHPQLFREAKISVILTPGSSFRLKTESTSMQRKEDENATANMTVISSDPGPSATIQSNYIPNTRSDYPLAANIFNGLGRQPAEDDTSEIWDFDSETVNNLSISRPAHHRLNNPQIPWLRARLSDRAGNIRSRRSPMLGPSPLRSMVLPESSEISSDRLSALHNDAQQRDAGGVVGLGLPFTDDPDLWTSTGPTSTRSGRKSWHNDGYFSRTCTPLDVIRELVAETSEWDASLYMDKGFKDLIEQSKKVPGFLSPVSPLSR